MYFSHAFRKTLLGAESSSGVLSTATGSTAVATSALIAGQLGLYDQKRLYPWYLIAP